MLPTISRSQSPLRKSYVDELLQRESHIEGIHRAAHTGIIQVTPAANAILPVSSNQLPYSNDTSSNNDYRYYPSANLTYPRIEEASNDSPKRLSLDDRLELELGIKKPDSTGDYPPSFGTYPYSTPVQLPPHASAAAYHHHPNVVQVLETLNCISPSHFIYCSFIKILILNYQL